MYRLANLFSIDKPMWFLALVLVCFTQHIALPFFPSAYHLYLSVSQLGTQFTYELMFIIFSTCRYHQFGNVRLHYDSSKCFCTLCVFSDTNLQCNKFSFVILFVLHYNYMHTSNISTLFFLLFHFTLHCIASIDIKRQ